MGTLYETDGRCHNAQPGSYGHECGKPAFWIGETANGYRSGFCQECKKHGWEARAVVKWFPRVVPARAIAKPSNVISMLDYLKESLQCK